MQIDVMKNYIARIEGSVGTYLFQHLYVVMQNGDEEDVANNGELSCAVHVSSVLALSGFIDRPHATVATTLRVMQEQGWEVTKKPQTGAVVYWGAGQDGHEHVGFWLSPDKVVSNSATKRVPILHSESMSDGRVPLTYYIHPSITTLS